MRSLREKEQYSSTESSPIQTDEQIRKPNFFIVGAPKCGTTSLYAYLRAHPEVFMSNRKEPLFFCTDFPTKQPLEEQEYLSLFQSAGGQKRIGEGSTWYLYSEKAREGIRAFSPDARIIIMLRNPVEMVHSLHSQMRWNAVENIRDLEEALAAEEDRKNGLHLPPDPFPVPLLIYRDLAKYSRYVEAYFRTFGKDRVLVILFEEFVTNTEKCFREVCEFLEIDRTFRPRFETYNPNKRLRSIRLRRLTRSPLRKVGYVLPLGLRQRVKRALLKVNTTVEKRSPMSTELRQRLEEEFEPEIARLSCLLERDLEAFWGGRASQP